MRYPRALRIACYLENSCSECTLVLYRKRISVKRGEQSIHALKLKPRAEEARQQLSLPNHLRAKLISHASAFKKALECLLIAFGDAFVDIRLIRKINADYSEPLLQLLHELCACLSRQVRFAHENEARHSENFQHAPKRLRVRLNAVGSAYYEHRIVEHLQASLRLRGEIRVTGSVKQCDSSISALKSRLLRKNSDALSPFQLVGIKEAVSVVDSAELSYPAGYV